MNNEECDQWSSTKIEGELQPVVVKSWKWVQISHPESQKKYTCPQQCCFTKIITNGQQGWKLRYIGKSVT